MKQTLAELIAAQDNTAPAIGATVESRAARGTCWDKMARYRLKVSAILSSSDDS